MTGITPYYEQEGITIYLGDSREVLPCLPDAGFDLVLTDPPYGINNNNGDLIHRREAALGLVKRGKREAGAARPIANDGAEANGLVRWMFCEARRLLKPGHCCCCCCGGGGPDPQFARWALWLDESIGFKQAVVWRKGGMGMGWHYRRDYEFVLVGEKPGAAGHWFGGHNVSNVIDTRRPIPTAKDHPTVKPVDLMAAFVDWHSTKGDLVLDPFMGSGTTLVAAKQLGRKAVGIEIEQKYCDIAIQRLSQEVLRF